MPSQTIKSQSLVCECVSINYFSQQRRRKKRSPQIKAVYELRIYENMKQFFLLSKSNTHTCQHDRHQFIHGIQSLSFSFLVLALSIYVRTNIYRFAIIVYFTLPRFRQSLRFNRAFHNSFTLIVSQLLIFYHIQTSRQTYAYTHRRYDQTFNINDQTIYSLQPWTFYFLIHLFNKLKKKKIYIYILEDGKKSEGPKLNEHYHILGARIQIEFLFSLEQR